MIRLSSGSSLFSSEAELQMMARYEFVVDEGREITIRGQQQMFEVQLEYAGS
jgi:hypothetical protein